MLDRFVIGIEILRGRLAEEETEAFPQMLDKGNRGRAGRDDDRMYASTTNHPVYNHSKLNDSSGIRMTFGDAVYA